MKDKKENQINNDKNLKRFTIQKGEAKLMTKEEFIKAFQSGNIRVQHDDGEIK